MYVFVPSSDISVLQCANEGILWSPRMPPRMRARCTRTMCADPLTCSQTKCLAANNWPAAQQRAGDLDAHLRTHGRPMGPLHGLPVSLMDRFHVRNLDSMCGFAAWVGSTMTADHEGSLLRALYNLGAVVHCKSNVPMTLLLGKLVAARTRHINMPSLYQTISRRDEQQRDWNDNEPFRHFSVRRRRCRRRGCPYCSTRVDSGVRHRRRWFKPYTVCFLRSLGSQMLRTPITKRWSRYCSDRSACSHGFHWSHGGRA